MAATALRMLITLPGLILYACEPSIGYLRPRSEQLGYGSRRSVTTLPEPSPAFATRGQESLKQSVFRGVVSQGRHHRVDGHYVTGIPSVVILGGGWPGKLILSFCNRSA